VRVVVDRLPFTPRLVVTLSVNRNAERYGRRVALVGVTPSDHHQLTVAKPGEKPRARELREGASGMCDDRADVF